MENSSASNNDNPLVCYVTCFIIYKVLVQIVETLYNEQNNSLQLWNQCNKNIYWKLMHFKRFAISNGYCKDISLTLTQSRLHVEIS